MPEPLPALSLVAVPGRRHVTLDLAREVERRGYSGIYVPSIFGNMAQSTALRLGSSLRLFGMHSVVDTEARALASARRWAEVVGAANLLHCTGAGTVAWAPGRGRLRRLPAEQVVARLAAGGAG